METVQNEGQQWLWCSEDKKWLSVRSLGLLEKECGSVLCCIGHSWSICLLCLQPMDVVTGFLPGFIPSAPYSILRFLTHLVHFRLLQQAKAIHGVTFWSPCRWYLFTVFPALTLCSLKGGQTAYLRDTCCLSLQCLLSLACRYSSFYKDRSLKLMSLEC